MDKSWVGKDFRNRMKKKRSGEKRDLINVSLIKDLKIIGTKALSGKMRKYK